MRNYGALTVVVCLKIRRMVELPEKYAPCVTNNSALIGFLLYFGAVGMLFCFGAMDVNGNRLAC